MSKPFKGVLNLDVRDSTPDWEPYLPPSAPAGSPNVLFLVIDDTGIAAWDTFGGMIEMPNLNRIAKLGLKYSNWHTTALCSPTRSCFLTGRNAHMNGMACITEGANGFPGANAVIPPENGTIAEMLLERGYSTFCIGKWHLTPETEQHMAASRRTWPTGRGFERYYGFLGGETNQWYPDLTEDNHFTSAPYGPEQGYHLSKDLVDKSIQYICDSQQVAPDKPWLLYLAFGANHAPHHSPKEWADKYKGKFDVGYEKYREMVLPRMQKLGIVPKGTTVSPINPWPVGEVISPGDQVLPWDSLNADQKRLFARMAENYAGFSSYTDHELGRLVDYLEESGQIDNTIIMVMSDNGASGEGGPVGSVNENKFFNGWPDDLESNLAKIDVLGGPETYPHYPTGWAMAFNTPYKMFKRYSLEGGVADPLIITWPKEMKKVAGQVRDQYHHCIDLVPTILDCCGVEPPAVIKGFTQTPIQGVSMRYTFDNPTAESTRQIQYYAMLGTRAIYHKGWKAVARHGALSGKSDFMNDKWELYHIETDRAECTDVSEQFPEKKTELIATWFAVAGANHVFPLDDRTAVEQLTVERPEPAKARDNYTYYPNTSEVPEGVAPNIRNRSYGILAKVNVTDPKNAQGILMAQGGVAGGHTLFLKGGKLYYVYNFLGMEEQKVVSADLVPQGEVILGVKFNREKEEPKGCANGTVTLYVNDKAVGSGKMRTQPGKFALAGEGLVIGRMGADSVTQECKAPFEFRGGSVKSVTINVTGEHYRNLEMEALAMLSRE
ncbi:MAG: arylsulfatase [Acidobacteriaceae bacterium]|nr:arylsulfatase [Acidobacteriaceae bacterium]